MVERQGGDSGEGAELGEAACRNQCPVHHQKSEKLRFGQNNAVFTAVPAEELVMFL